MDNSIIQRLRHYVGKDRKQVTNPCITAREAIVIADYIDQLEKQVVGKLPPVEHLCQCGYRWRSEALTEPCPRCNPTWSERDIEVMAARLGDMLVAEQAVFLTQRTLEKLTERMLKREGSDHGT